MSASPSGPSPENDQKAFNDALDRLFLPVAQLCLGRGVPFLAVEERLKRAFVDAARAQTPGSMVQRDVSRVSAATGINRREVTRITQDEARSAVLRPSPVTQLFTRWVASRKLRDRKGRPKPLKRQGDAPSFEALAQSVTRDVHPRTLLEELCRLGLARWDVDADTVLLLRDTFVPQNDEAGRLEYFGHNVGDHIAAAAENVMAKESQHLEQALFADELSEASARSVRLLVDAQWKKMLTSLVPEIEAMMEADQKSGRLADQRVRVGLYSYRAPMKKPSDGTTQ